MGAVEAASCAEGQLKKVKVGLLAVEEASLVIQMGRPAGLEVALNGGDRVAGLQAGGSGGFTIDRRRQRRRRQR